MADKFDQFSKHLAARQSRRGIFKILGAGVIGAALSTIFSSEADARGPRRVPPSIPVFNGLLNKPAYETNGTKPYYPNATLYEQNQTLPIYEYNNTKPPAVFNNTMPIIANPAKPRGPGR